MASLFTFIAIAAASQTLLYSVFDLVKYLIEYFDELS